MSKQYGLHTALNYFHKFQPCKGIVVVGSGAGCCVDLLFPLGISEVLLAEADEKLIDRMKNLYAIPSTWHIVNTVVYKNTQECEFYHTSQIATNAIVHPDTLHAAWPNLKELSTEICGSMSLETLQAHYAVSQTNWLMIECYGAKEILQANADALKSYEIVVAKTLKSTQESQDAFMENLNYRSIYTVAENNPQIVMVVYVKDWHTQLTHLQAKSEQTREELEQKVTELITQKEEEQTTAKAKLESLETKLQETKEQKEKEYQELQATNAKLSERAESAEETSRQLQEQIKQKEEQLAHLQAQSEQTRKVLQTFQAQDTELQKENEKQMEELKKIIEESQTKIDENKEFQKDVYEYKRAKNYFIKPTYVSRTEYTHYDDQSQDDKWQLEVYLHALGLMKKHDLKSVVDLGCGSGYKLMKYLSDYKTIGLELGVNMEFLKEKYPEKTWLESNFEIDHHIKTDVLICSDVIEHIVNPDQLIRYMQKISFKYLILSTPDRELVYQEGMPFLDGPPLNPAHVREWNFVEFRDYIGQYFEIIDHRVTNLQQSTQMIICKKCV